MEHTTFETLSHLAEERFRLYRLAGHQSLTPDQIAQIHEITGRLSVLWDEYRREVASSSGDSLKRVASERRYAALDTWAPAEREAPAEQRDISAA